MRRALDRAGARRRATSLPDALRERGAAVDELALYRTVAAPLDDAGGAAALGADYLDLRLGLGRARSSPRRPARSTGPRLVSIGPVTSDALRELGPEPDVEAAEHTPDGLVAALLADVAAGAEAAPGAVSR